MSLKTDTHTHTQAARTQTQTHTHHNTMDRRTLWTPKRTVWSQRWNVVKLGHSLKGGEKCLGINVCLQGRIVLSVCAGMKACECVFHAGWG